MTQRSYGPTYARDVTSLALNLLVRSVPLSRQFPCAAACVDLLSQASSGRRAPRRVVDAQLLSLHAATQPIHASANALVNEVHLCAPLRSPAALADFPPTFSCCLCQIVRSMPPRRRRTILSLRVMVLVSSQRARSSRQHLALRSSLAVASARTRPSWSSCNSSRAMRWRERLQSPPASTPSCATGADRRSQRKERGTTDTSR